MHRLCAQHSPDCETLYQLYWQGIVRYCATRLGACPDGTAEEVAQDVFFAAHCALTAQRYRGESALHTWLFGIAHHLCANMSRDTSRKTVPMYIRQLERQAAQLHHEVTALASTTAPQPREQSARLEEQLIQMHRGLDHARLQLSCRIREAMHHASGSPWDAPDLQQEAQTVMRTSFQRLAQQDRYAYTLLHMHVIKGASVRELAAWQGLSRSVVQRRLVQARATLRQVYQTCWREVVS